jgi:hypothetical protein
MHLHIHHLRQAAVAAAAAICYKDVSTAISIAVFISCRSCICTYIACGQQAAAAGMWHVETTVLIAQLSAATQHYLRFIQTSSTWLLNHHPALTAAALLISSLRAR